MSRINDIENYLHFFAQIYKENPNMPIKEDSIYYYLVRDRDTKKAIMPFHQKWINDFKNTPNIKVFVAEDWKYFCQFVNLDKNIPLNNELKLYIPVDAEHIDKAATDIFNYLAVNNIHHHSKIGRDERRDNIVVRLQNEKDLEPFRNFVHQNKNIRDGLIQTNPFNINDGIIGYAADDKLSYNSVVTKLITNYLSEKRNNNNLDNVSYQDFFLYCSNIYSKTFDRGNSDSISLFMEKFQISDDLSKDELIDKLNNYREVIDLILTSMQTNSLDKYKEHINNIHNKEKVQFEKDKIAIEINPELSPIKQYIEIMIDRYGYSDGVATIIEFIKTKNYNYVTKDLGLRDTLQKYDPDKLVADFKIVASKLNIQPPKVENNKRDKQTTNNEKITVTNIIDDSIDGTIRIKYPNLNEKQFISIKKEYVISGLTQIMDNQNYSIFTRSNNIRSNMQKLNTNSICLELIKGAVISSNFCHSEYNGKQIPDNTDDVIRYVSNIVVTDGPSYAYQMVLQYPSLQKQLMEVYANYITTTTKKDRETLTSRMDTNLQDKFNNLEEFLIKKDEQSSYKATSAVA